MGCGGDREKGLFPTAEQKWDYITLSDFKSTSCLTPFSYVWLWMLVIISVAVYAADAFTAVNLLAFNKWSGEVKPKVSFDVAKWIFAVCIILSYVFLAYRWFRAWRVIRSDSVTESYLEPLAAIFNSLRVSTGWKRFLVYASLTKSRKGVDYLALFVYFQFKAALLVVFAQGPRIAINALTLWAVMQAEIIPVGDHAAPEDVSPVIQFFKNIGTMTKEGNKREVVIYYAMLFSLVVWVIAALSLILSVVLYLLFLWHYVPNSDGTLTNYCRRKMETRLDRIVNKKARKAAEKDAEERKRKEERAMRKAMKKGEIRRPDLFLDDETDSVVSMSTTTTTLPPYPARTNTTSSVTTSRTVLQKPSLPSVSERTQPSRSNTSTTFASDAPLLNDAGSMGLASPTPPMPSMDRNGDFRAGPGSRPPLGTSGRPFSPQSQQPGPLPPLNTQHFDRATPSPHLISPLQNPPSGHQNLPYPAHDLQSGDPTFSPYDNRAPMVGPSYELSPVEISPLADVLQHYDSISPIEASESGTTEVPSALRPGPAAQHQDMSGGYAALPPSRAGTAPPSHPRAGLPATLQSAIQRREAAQPFGSRGPDGMMQQQRSVTAPLQHPGWAQGPTPRSNTTLPGAGYRRDMSQTLPYRGRGPASMMPDYRGDHAYEHTESDQSLYPRSNTVGPRPDAYSQDSPQSFAGRPNVMTQQMRSATVPPEQPAGDSNSYPRSNTAGPSARGYDGFDFSQR